MDASRLAHSIEKNRSVDASRLNEMIQLVKVEAMQNSPALKKFKDIMYKNGKTAVQRFETQDHNKDGVLNLDGFKAALMVPEFNIRGEEVVELYGLVCSPNSGFQYAQWISQHCPQHK